MNHALTYANTTLESRGQPQHLNVGLGNDLGKVPSPNVFVLVTTDIINYVKIN